MWLYKIIGFLLFCNRCVSLFDFLLSCLYVSLLFVCLIVIVLGCFWMKWFRILIKFVIIIFFY